MKLTAVPRPVLCVARSGQSLATTQRDEMRWAVVVFVPSSVVRNIYMTRCSGRMLPAIDRWHLRGGRLRPIEFGVHCVWLVKINK